MSGTYARETSVSAEKSRGEIERILSRYGATAFGYGWNADGAIVSFEATANGDARNRSRPRHGTVRAGAPRPNRLSPSPRRALRMLVVPPAASGEDIYEGGKVKLAEITEADVIEAALDQITSRNGYDATDYFRSADGDHLSGPGPRVGATCAIGGVEQAIWRLTGEVVTKDRPKAAYKGRAASHRKVSRLYARAMKLLNAAAQESRYAKEMENGGCAIEELTGWAGRPTVVKAFRLALERAKADAKKGD